MSSSVIHFLILGACIHRDAEPYCMHVCTITHSRYGTKTVTLQFKEISLFLKYLPKEVVEFDTTLRHRGVIHFSRFTVPIKESLDVLLGYIFERSKR